MASMILSFKVCLRNDGPWYGSYSGLPGLSVLIASGTLDVVFAALIFVATRRLSPKLPLDEDPHGARSWIYWSYATR
jgi:hypothetical protein